MRSFLGRWKVRHLVWSWAAYWAVLAAATLGPGIAAVWRLSQQGVKGDASASITDGVVNLTVNAAGATVWSGAASLAILGLALAGPPILVWMLWMAEASAERRSGTSPRELASGDELPLRREQREREGLRR